MSVCTFLGHRECHDLEYSQLYAAIETLIAEGVDEFLVGHQGQFDRMVYRCLQALQKQYAHIRYYVVLAQLPQSGTSEYDGHTLYPEGLEIVPPKYAIDRRNQYLVNTSDICLCFINRTWGGAYKFSCLAKQHGKKVINLGSVIF